MHCTLLLLWDKNVIITKIRWLLGQQSAILLIIIVFTLFLLFSPDVNGATFNHPSISYTVENDGLLGTDRGYTSGLFVSLNSKASKIDNPILPQVLLSSGGKGNYSATAYRQWKLTLGQQIWTPTDISGKEPLDKDRPYAGLVFIKAKMMEQRSNVADKYSIMLGTVGPRAMAEESQTSVHNIIGSKEPVGWHQQIENELVFSFAFERQALFYRAATGDGKLHEIALGSRVQIGNYQNEIAINSTFRWGKALSKSFSAVSLNAGELIDSAMLARSEKGSFFYVSLEGRYRSQDITIDGDRPARFLNAVNIAHWQTSLASGYVTYNKSVGLGLSVMASSSDYQEDSHQYHGIVSLNLFWRI